MEDFIKGLQGEIKRLQDLTNDLQMQLILAGVNPQIPDPKSSDKQPFQNICPQCAQTKAMQRPASSHRNLNMAKVQEFKIKKGQMPAGVAAIKNRRQLFEQEQQDFI
mmetsp:Transcript_13373/g.22765  ORF Transcript_13373/g.22765 Transcript_13373/m.22765 type:complete len:107 (+) Transcript_13373:1056-1376(+)